jgi:hypothetical protein
VLVSGINEKSRRDLEVSCRHHEGRIVGGYLGGDPSSVGYG